MTTNKIKYSPTFNEEKIYLKKGYQYVVGTDEVGKGSFAGPVVVGAVVFNRETDFSILEQNAFSEVNDSKLLSSQKREKLIKIIKKESHLCLIEKISVRIINEVGIGKATEKAFRKVLMKIGKKLKKENFFVLVDGFHVRHIKGIGLKNQKAIVKGDRKCFSIAAASIIAKVYRDRLMDNLGKKYPQYLFSKNKGYGTKEHQQAIKKHGLSEVHRKSFNLTKFTSV